jgi:Fe-S-cluster containining protein
LETEMLLSAEDIAQLEKRGYKKEFFVRIDKAGYAVLRNRQGRCVFFDAEKRRCNVYAGRPSGCRVYPVIFDEDKGVVADTVCQARGTVTEKEKARKGKKVLKLLKLLDREAEQRSSGSK